MPYHIFLQQQVRYIIIETKEFARIGYNGFLFQHLYSGDGLGVTHLGLHPSTHAEKRNPLYPIRSASFVSIVLYPIHNKQIKGYKKMYMTDHTFIIGFCTCKSI